LESKLLLAEIIHIYYGKDGFTELMFCRLLEEMDAMAGVVAYK
jgi:hypothetical protein